MARNKHLYTRGTVKMMEVFLRSNDQKVATLYQNSGSTTYRYRLVTSPNRHSKILSDVAACLREIEREIL